MPKDEAPASAGPLTRVQFTPEVARAALEFLSRAPIPIHLSEAEALLRVRMALQAAAEDA